MLNNLGRSDRLGGGGVIIRNRLVDRRANPRFIDGLPRSISAGRPSNAEQVNPNTGLACPILREIRRLSY